MNDTNINKDKVNMDTDELTHDEGTVTPPDFHNKKYTVEDGYALGTACPTQIFLNFRSGCLGYARYRWGRLTIRISDNADRPSEQDAVSGELIFSEKIGDEMDGILSIDELKEETEHIIHYNF